MQAVVALALIVTRFYHLLDFARVEEAARLADEAAHQQGVLTNVQAVVRNRERVAVARVITLGLTRCTKLALHLCDKNRSDLKKK